MSTMAGTFSFKFLSIALQYRVFSIPWATRKSAILCLRERGFNSSSSLPMPVRYIPKKSKKTNENDDKNMRPLRIDRHERHEDNNIQRLLFADAKRERNELEETDSDLEVIDECLVKEHVDVVLKEARIGEQRDISQLGTVGGNEAVAVKEPEGRISQHKDIGEVGIFQESKVVEDVKRLAEEKIDRGLKVVDRLMKEPEKVVVMERRTGQQNDVWGVDILQSSKAAEDLKKLTEVKEQRIDRYALVVEEPEENVVKDTKLSRQKEFLKEGILQGSKASREIKKLTEDKEETETGDVLLVMNSELIEKPEEDPVEEIGINQKEGYDETMHDVEKAAIKLLAKRAYTIVELKKKLQAKRFPPRIVDTIVNGFEKRGLINDSWYAESFSRSRWSSSSWGPGRIKSALSMKGVSKTNVEKAVKVVFEEGESGEDQEVILGMSKVSMDHLFVQASKQWLRRPEEKRKASIIHWLEYRGFRWNVISFIVKKLESQNPP